MPMPRKALALASLLALGSACGSGGPGGASAPLVEPNVEALSTYSARLGEVIEVYGTDFDADALGHELHFVGNFEAADGSSSAVNFRSPARFTDGGLLRWGGFGPYNVPFANNGDQPGTFYGTVGVVTTKNNPAAPGEVVEVADATPLNIVFDVQPSLVVRDFQPITASCAGEIRRGVAGFPYRLEVEALGFQPETFTYSISRPGEESNPQQIRHIAEGATDVVGQGERFVLADVPEGQNSYTAVISVTARDAQGQALTTAFGVTVHRPIEIYYNGGFEVAEIYDPVPVSGCLPGGEAGRDVRYSENMSESRSRSANTSWNDNWVSNHTVSSTDSATINTSVSNGIGFATTNGTDFRWDVSGEFGGKAKVPLLVEASFGGRIGQSNGQSSSRNQNTNRTEGLSESTTSTDSESMSQGTGGSQGGGFSWSVNSSDSVGRDFSGHVIAGTYGVFYRQTYRIIRPAAIVAYNQCGEAEVVGEVDFTDWIWASDLALGRSCPNFPPSNLPEGRCLVEPCDGQE